MQIAFAASPRAEGQNALRDLVKRYGQAEVGAADYLVAIGGDGAALRALHATLVGETKPVFAMRLHGSIGHLSKCTRRRLPLRWPMEVVRERFGNWAPSPIAPMCCARWSSDLSDEVCVPKTQVRTYLWCSPPTSA
jgi:hypothetical protein